MGTTLTSLHHEDDTGVLCMIHFDQFCPYHYGHDAAETAGHDFFNDSIMTQKRQKDFS